MKKKRLTDRDFSRLHGPRPLTSRQIEVLEAMEAGGTQWEAYCRLVDSGRWVVPYSPATQRRIPSLRNKAYPLTFLNFRQHLVNAYGRLQVHSLQEALSIYRKEEGR